ncbi:MAG: phosphotransferase [Proteobacteria bacterium]|nr:phosphotransferase [Pseudomonadota bacterium]
MNKLDPNIKQEVLGILAKSFSHDIQIKSVIRLSKPERRNLILRIILQSPSGKTPQSLIFKQSFHEKDSDDEKELLGRFARDWAGLEFLSGLNIEPSIAPQFYGGSEKHRFILLEDLGDVHFSLVDSLTGKDRKAAIAALTRYMQRMGQYHASAYGKTDEYNKILQKLNPGAKVWKDDFDDLPKANTMLEKLGIKSTSELDEEIFRVFNTMKKSMDFTTYIHGDICPDNVFDDPKNDIMHVIDFEWGYVGNALLDATYLRMSMPTCWCVKALPKDVIEPLEIIYLQELAKNIPAALDDNLYNESYVCACAYWVVILFAYGIDGVLDKELDILNTEFKDPHPNWKSEYNMARPRYLHRLQAFIDISEKHGKLPHLKLASEQALKELKIRWPDTKPLELFPAFI